MRASCTSSPRPRAGAPPNLEQTLLQQVKDALEHESHTCGEGCECVIGEPVAVASRTQYKKVSDGDYTAWYQVTLTKYRTTGECMPASDPLPGGACAGVEPVRFSRRPPVAGARLPFPPVLRPRRTANDAMPDSGPLVAVAGMRQT